jgi:methyl-accepting chemotaxis protein
MRVLTGMSIRWKLLTPVILILALTLGQLYLMVSMSQDQQEDTALVNLSGRQRMLSQKMTKETFEYLLTNEPQLTRAQAETIAVFEGSLQALLAGGEVELGGRKVQVKPHDLKEIKVSLNEAKVYWEGVKPLFVEAVRQTKGLQKEELNALNEASLQLLGRFDKITAMYEAHSSAAAKRNMTLVYAGLVFYLVAAAAVWFIASRNIIQPIVSLRDEANKIAAGDLSFGK